jgi:hypothetical protein
LKEVDKSLTMKEEIMAADVEQLDSMDKEEVSSAV